MNIRLDPVKAHSAGQRLNRVGQDAQSYASSADGPMESVLGTNSGFATMGQLQAALSTLKQQRDGIISDTQQTAQGILTAITNITNADAHSVNTMEAFRNELGGSVPGEGLTAHSISPDNAMCEALGVRDPGQTGQATGLAGAGQSLLHTLGMPQNSPLGSAGTASWATGETISRGGDISNYMANVRNGRWAPRAADGTFISPKNMSVWDRAVSGSKGEFRALPGASGTRAAWNSAGKWAGRAAGAIGVATSTAEQVARDRNDSTLTGDEKVGRAVWRGAVEGGGGIGGGLLGAKIGAGIGTVIAPGVGTVIGGAVGGLVGGIAGSEFGGWIADKTVAGAGAALEWITPW